MHVRAYLRASTDQQNAERALEALWAFSESFGYPIVATYAENASGATTDRVELARLLRDSLPGDVLLVESLDRLTRLAADDWIKLRSAIDSKGLSIVALDLPTSHQAMTATPDEFTRRMLTAINGMLVEVMAAVARKDYELRKQRQAQGIDKARASGKYPGRQPNQDLHKRIRELLKAGLGVRATARHAKCSTTTVQRIKNSMASVGRPTDKTRQRPTP